MKRSKAERDALRQSSSPHGEDGRGLLLIRQSQFQKAEYRRLKQAWEQRIYEDEAPLRELQPQVERL